MDRKNQKKVMTKTVEVISTVLQNWPFSSRYKSEMLPLQKGAVSKAFSGKYHGRHP
ncbi:hypothetical protein P4475_08755 [Halalkalibacterium halodurans]|uniref:hypothetical protein n=1 Tax=Halalkalibacterium halodurans TaxID=86665 RepID=UPI002E213F56|nr:hypothetical protein [Halalkalibacterium halodurans]